MPGRRKEDISLPELERMVYETQKIGNEARAAVGALSIKVESLRDQISKKHLEDAMDSRKERKEKWHDLVSGGWKFIGAVTLSLISFAASLVLNWDRAGVFMEKAHWGKHVNVPVAMVQKKPRRRRKPKALPPVLPPVLVPELKDEKSNESESE